MLTEQLTNSIKSSTYLNYSNNIYNSANSDNLFSSDNSDDLFNSNNNNSLIQIMWIIHYFKLLI